MSNVGEHGPGADPGRRVVVPEVALPPQPPLEDEGAVCPACEAMRQWLEMVARGQQAS